MTQLIDIILKEEEANLNIDKVIVSFNFEDEFRKKIETLEVGGIIHEIDCDLKLKTINIEGDNKIHTVEIISFGEVYGQFLIQSDNNSAIFVSAEETGYQYLKRDKDGYKVSTLHFLDVISKSLGLTFNEIREITFGLDTPRNLLGKIKGRLENLDHSDEFDNIDEGEGDTIFIMETQYGKDKPLPIGSWQNNCLLITDTFSNCTRLKIYNSSIMSPERRGYIAKWNEFTPLFYRVELKAFSNEINFAVEEYNETHNLNCSPLEILGGMDMAKYVFNYIIENLPTEMLEIDIVPDYFLKTLNERPHEANHFLPIYTRRRLNIDALKLKCSHDGKLYSIIKEVPVGEIIPWATTDYDLKVVGKKVEKDMMVTTVEVSTTTDGTYGHIIFKEDSEECLCDIEKKVFYTLLTRNIHEGTKHSMLGCLDYILDSFNLHLVSITNMTVCCDIDHNLIDKIWDKMIETGGKDNDDIIFTLVSMIKGKGNEATEEDLYKSTLIYRNVKTGTPQLRIYTSPSIADEDVRNMIEDWNEFKPFSRIEITLNEEQLQDFLSKYTHPYGNDYPLLSFIDDEKFKRAILLNVADNHIEPNKTDFDIRVEEV